MDLSELMGCLGERERNVLFNDAHNTFYLQLYGVGHIDLLEQMGRLGEREMFYLTMHSTHFIYSYMASDILTFRS